tara:strand:- start:117 stop:887 length:771 start_codon:yes stop_codon:yes gene_type:complete
MNYINHINYKEGNIIYNLLKNKNHNNIVLQGLKNTGKKSLIKCIFNDLNICFYEFNKNNFKDIIDEIKKITHSYDYYKMDLKYILINDFESMKNVEQNKLKIIIEKSYVSSRFILITNNLTKMIHPIQSRSVIIRISKKNENMINISEKWNEKNKNERNLDSKYKEKLIKILFNIFKKFSLKKIKQFSLKLKEIDIDITEFLKYILDEIMKKYSFNIIKKCIKDISHYEYLIQKSYTDIIYLESLFIRIYYNINND